MARVLITGSLLDTPTVISSDFALKIATWAKANGHNVTTMVGLTATRLPFRLILMAPFDVIFYFGHGNEYLWLGDDVFLGLVVAGDNSSWLKGKIVCGMPVCLSAQALGPDLIKSGALAFFGSTEEMFAAFPESEHDYLSDFEDCWGTLIQAILNNQSMGDCLAAYQAKCTEYISLYSSHLSDWSNADWYRDKLTLNRDYYVQLGNSELHLIDVVASNYTGLSFGSDWRDWVLSFSVAGTVAATAAGLATTFLGAPELAPIAAPVAQMATEAVEKQFVKPEEIPTTIPESTPTPET